MRTQKEIDADPGKGMDADTLDHHFNPYGGGEHPYYTRTEWRYSVAQHNTCAGYRDWLEHTLTKEDPEEEESTTSYTIELTKQIVVTVEATSYQAALDEISNNDGYGFDVAWEHAEAAPLLLKEFP